ncbi:MAG TPA: hypothetical protein VFB81_23665, partial [Myxococcales bacterium]|nr:hypothetical protein [Myxococcales bacterium]
QGVSYGALSSEQRTQMSGMDERGRAILHLWGIQMGSAGTQDGGVLLNVLQNPEKFKPAEVQLAKELAAQDRATYGGITGKSLDQAFFGVYQGLTGQDISQRYAFSPIQYARGPVDTNNRLSGANGLNNFENEVLQLWGHSPLFTGSVDGSILDYSLNSANRLEVNLNNNDLLALKEADLASDGVLNGDSLNKSMLSVLDRVYLGAPSASVGRTMNEALEEASARRLGLLPPPRQAAAGVANPIGLGQRAGGSGCPFLSSGIQVQPSYQQQKTSAPAQSPNGYSTPSASYTPPPASSYTAPATPTPVKPSPATISY